MPLFSIRDIFDNSIYFFFQAEDGIRDWSVTGVQTCALPICLAQVRRHRDEGLLQLRELAVRYACPGRRREIATCDLARRIADAVEAAGDLRRQRERQQENGADRGDRDDQVAAIE